MPSAIERRFLGWDGPALPKAAAWLIDQAGGEAPERADSGEADLANLLVVVPGARSRRMLVGLLVDEAETRGVVLTPPIIVTPGELPAALLGPAGEPAPALVRRLAWIESLRSLDPEAIAPLLPNRPPADDLQAWSRLSALLERVSDDLAGADLRFEQVPDRAGDALPPDDAERWRTLGGAQRGVERRLGEQGYVDERLAMRDHAARARSGDTGFQRAALVCAPELNRIERAAIEKSGASVVALIFAPETMAERFDHMGCVDAEAWSQEPIDLSEESVVFANDPAEQAERALAHLAGFGDPLDVNEAVIGVADPEMFERLARKAELAAGVPLRPPRGEPCSATPPGRLLDLLRDHLRDATFDTMGALARHPDVEAALRRRSPGGAAETEWWLAPLDEIRRERVLLDPAAPPASLHPREGEALRFVRTGLADLLGDLTTNAPRPLAAWAEAIDGALAAIYEGTSLDPARVADQRTIAGLEAIRDALGELRAAGDAGQAPCSSWRAVALIGERLEQTFIPEPPRRGAIETIGWLDLALDPAPHCVVVGMSERHVPGSVTHDPLLPHSLREALGLPTNASRLARDACLLAAIDASRGATFMVARRTSEGDPQTPSRLLFRCAGEPLARRVLRFTDPKRDAGPNIALASKVRAGGVDRFRPEVRIDSGYEPPVSMSVTEFDAYLRSPVGWYLERFLRLEEHDEPPRELTPRLYGSLAHDTLEAFGRDEQMRDMDDPQQIAEALSDLLDDAARRRFGERPPAAVRIQKEMLRYRLQLMAGRQAERRRSGWRIERVEWSPGEDDAAGASIDVDGDPMGLRGKIDRIDRHEDGRAAIIDYKTGSIPSKGSLKKAPGDPGKWKSLQLPLYRHLARGLDLPAPVEVGYAMLPAKEAEDAWHFALWDEEALRSADKAAREVVRRIRAYRPGHALEPGDSPPDTGVLGFLSGQRFATGGLEGEHEEADEAEATP